MRIGAVLLALCLCVPCCSSGGGGDDGEDPDLTDKYSCDGAPAQCLRFGAGWQFSGMTVLDTPALADVCVIRLSDGRYRLYANSAADETPNNRVFCSWISNDAVSFVKEPGIRLQGDGLFRPWVVEMPNGDFRLYYTDQTQMASYYGAKAMKSALSADGLAFAVEAGERLTCLLSGNESNGLGSGRVLPLPDGRYRMYYSGFQGDNVRILSAISDDGLAWVRESGVRVDNTTFCPEKRDTGLFAPFRTSDGIFHLILGTTRCEAGWKNAQSGFFDFSSPDGLAFTGLRNYLVAGYYRASAYTGKPDDPRVDPQDPAAVMTPQGLRVYFDLWDGDQMIAESGNYGMINTGIR